MIPSSLFFAALFFLRHQIVLDLELTYPAVFSLGLDIGMVYDLVVVLFPLILARIAWVVFRFPYAHGWIVISFLVYLASIANLLYFRFFGTRLQWWIVQLHWTDITKVNSSAGHLGLTVSVIASILCMAGALVIALRWLPKQPWPANSVANPRRRRPAVLASALLILVLDLFIRQSPVWTRRISFQDNVTTGEIAVLSDQILTIWFNEFIGHWQDLGGQLRDELKLAQKTGKRPAFLLAQFRGFEEKNGIPGLGHLEAFDWPLRYEFRVTDHERRDLRRRLALPEDGPINIIVLFLESTRMFEYYHPRLGPILFPNIRKHVDERGILFEQSYSSSAEAGQTVRGKFSTLCSMFPNFNGPATYIAYNSLNITCIQDALKSLGYQNLWFNSINKTFHGNYVFESLHGTSEFFDEEHFFSKGITKKIGDWGLADELMLDESLNVMEKKAESGPFFSDILTIATHFPHRFIPEGELPQEVVEETKTHLDYQAYLSQLRYQDKAVGQFLDRFYKSSIGDNTLVVMLGDHSVPVRPHLELNDRQWDELKARVPVVLLTKNQRNPEKIATQVHQLDVAPTIARVVGFEGNVSWLGRGLFQAEGTPWLFRYGAQLFYRTRNTGCYTYLGKTQAECFRLDPGTDPLFDENLPRIAENVERSRFFSDIIHAVRQSIVFNLVAPPKSL